MSEEKKKPFLHSLSEESRLVFLNGLRCKHNTGTYIYSRIANYQSDVLNIIKSIDQLRLFPFAPVVISKQFSLLPGKSMFQTDGEKLFLLHTDLAENSDKRCIEWRLGESLRQAVERAYGINSEEFLNFQDSPSFDVEGNRKEFAYFGIPVDPVLSIFPLHITRGEAIELVERNHETI